MVKRAERGCARAPEQVYRPRELMPSSPVSELESRVARNFSAFAGAKDTEYRSSWVRLRRAGTETERGIGDTRSVSK